MIEYGHLDQNELVQTFGIDFQQLYSVSKGGKDLF